jgi:tellurite resistance protein TerA
MADNDLDFDLINKGSQKYMLISELKVQLSWTANVDLDLMAFYKCKNGDSGGVYSDMYSDHGTGSLTNFPFMQLDQDAGVGAGEGSKVETLTIKRFDEIAEIYLVAMNFTDASADRKSKFTQFDGIIEVSNEKDENFKVFLDSRKEGNVAVFARIEHSNDLMGAILHNESKVYSFSDFRKAIPGANRLSLANKLLLQGRGDSAPLNMSSGQISAALNWKANVDLDLHCFYSTKAVAGEKKSGGFFASLFGSGNSGREAQSGHIYFGARGKIGQFPYIELDQDAGVGDQGGDNEENIRLGDVAVIDQAIIVANIFNKPNARFATYDGAVTIFAGERSIEVPLMESAPGAWCIIAQIDNRSGVPSIVNINQTQKAKPERPDVV